MFKVPTLWLIVFLCSAICVFSGDKTICLNMIVKNESRAIEKCLASVKPYIDYWVIVDTGSTDGTQELIKQALSGIPGELYERPWINFEVNRNEALVLAKGKSDYALLIDADEKLELSDKNASLPLTADCCYAVVRESGADYHRIFLIDLTLPWYWKGVLHESLMCDSVKTFEVLGGGYLISNTADGFRSQDEQKYLKDARVLEDALKDEPMNARYVFYLGQSYFNAREFAKAREVFQRRSLMGGWDQEVYWSLYRVAQIDELMGDLTSAEAGFQSAYRVRKVRAEPIYQLANLYIQQKKFLAAYALARFGVSMPHCTDQVFVEHWIYAYGMREVLAHAAFELGFLEETYSICTQLIAIPELPEPLKERIEGNLAVIRKMGIIHK